MTQTMTFALPDGFRMIERECRLDIMEARVRLLSKKPHNLSSAVRKGDEVKFTWHLIECPYCGSQLPAFEGKTEKKGSITYKAIAKWAEPQYSLFEDGGSRLVFHTVSAPEDSYRCPCCRQESRPFYANQEVRISARKQKLTVSCRSMNLKSVLALAKTAAAKQNRVQLPLTEELSFNLRKGRASISIRDCGGNPILVRDITWGERDWKGTTLYSLLDSNDMMKRRLSEAFSWIYGGELPFAQEELSPLNAVAMTRFRGFARPFYDSIPYELSDGRLDPGFHARSKRIRREEDLPALLEKSSLPQAKSLRRLLFTCQGFFFYLPELESLWEIIGDINYFTRLLNTPMAFSLLSFLHQYPGASAFLRDYRDRKGMENLFSLLDNRWREASDYALVYCAMSPDARKREQEGWRHSKEKLRYQQTCSIPMPTGVNGIQDCTIDGFSFEWLRTGREYFKAGLELHNCLGEWSGMFSPVVAVKQHGRIVAAIEIRENTVEQARGAYNEALDEDEDLRDAYEKWKQKYGLKDWTDLEDEFDF